MGYKICVTILCLVSSYFYGFLSMNNYNKPPDLSYRHTNIVMIIMFETVFLIDLILSFLVDYTEEDQPEKPVRDLGKIAMNYLRTGFLLDIITLIPLNFLNLYRRRNVLFLIIKMLRIHKGFALFDVPRIMTVVKKGYQSKMEYIIKKHPKLANDVDQDNNKIGEVLFISF